MNTLVAQTPQKQRLLQGKFLKCVDGLWACKSGSPRLTPPAAASPEYDEDDEVVEARPGAFAANSTPRLPGRR